MITLRRVVEDDFPLLRTWLEQPHVARWWNHETSPEAVERDFGPTARGEEPAEDFLALLGSRPLGLVQRCLVADYPEDFAPLAAATDVPPHAAMLDYLIGSPTDTGRGLGPAMLAAALTLTWRDLPLSPCVIVPVVAANRPSWRALEHTGFRRVAEADMEPDNPVDLPLHYIYRLDRP